MWDIPWKHTRRVKKKTELDFLSCPFLKSQFRTLPCNNAIAMNAGGVLQCTLPMAIANFSLAFFCQADCIQLIDKPRYNM